MKYLADQKTNLETIPYIDSEDPEDIVIVEDYEFDTLINKTIYVANTDTDTIAVFDGITNTRIKDIPVVDKPSGLHLVKLLDENYKLYVASSADEYNNISVISTTNNEVIKNIKVGDGPFQFKDYKPNLDTNPKLYVTNSFDIVSLIDTTTDEVIENITVGYGASTLELANKKIYIANSYDNTVSVINRVTDEVIKNITVGEEPVYLLNDPDDKLYVANSADGTVSVINTTTDEVIKNITVGERPFHMKGFFEGKLYVLKDSSDEDSLDTISIVNTTTDEVIKHITVGHELIDVESGRGSGHKLYVANSADGTVSVINTTTDEVIKNITGIGADNLYAWQDAIYVLGDNKFHIVDTTNDRLVAGVVLNVNAATSGIIRCSEDFDVPLNQYMYIHSNTECEAIPIKGFEFVSWVENLSNNSTRTLKTTSVDMGFINSFLDTIGWKPSKAESKLNITQFGNFTANFVRVPPPISPEYWIPLYGIIVSTIVGWSIPSIIGWTRDKADIRKLNHYHKKINKLDEDKKLDEKDNKDLDDLKRDVSDAYSKGKINEKHYERLNNEISMLYEEIFRKRIESINNSPKNTISKQQLIKFKEEIEIAYSKEKITELHFNLLSKKILDIELRDNDKASDEG